MNEDISLDRHLNRIFIIPFKENRGYGVYFIWLFLIPVTSFSFLSLIKETKLDSVDYNKLEVYMELLFFLVTVFVNSLLFYFFNRFVRTIVKTFNDIGQVLDDKIDDNGQFYDKYLNRFVAGLKLDFFRKDSSVKRRKFLIFMFVFTFLCGLGALGLNIFINSQNFIKYEFQHLWIISCNPLGVSFKYIYLLFMFGYFFPITIWYSFYILYSLQNLMTDLRKRPERVAFSHLISPNSSGLNSVGTVFTQIMGMLFLISFLLAIYIGVNGFNPLTFIYIGIVILFVAGLVFLFPLYPSHKLIVTKKKVEILKLVKKHDFIYHKYLKSIQVGKYDESQETYLILSNLQKLIDEYDKLQEWPFDVKVLYRNIIFVFLPVVGLIVQIFFSRG